MAGKGSSKDNSSSSGSRKTTPARPQEQTLKCPRCDSQNTKFCYYNNYSLTQPRHFCKTCRRYWTNGGALRNVPIGGGCRKNKKMKSTSRLSLDSKDSSGTSDISGLKFFQGITPAMDFQLGGLNFPRVVNSNSSTNLYNQFPSFGDNIPITSAPIAFNLDPSASTSSLMGFNFPISSSKSLQTPAGFQETNPMNYHTNLASSIESLSSLNQDMHWKLQQQRFYTLFGGDLHKETGFQGSNIGVQIQKPQPIFFNDLESSKRDGNVGDHSRKEECSATGNLATEWFFDPTPTSSSGNENANNWNGIQGWSNLNQYSPLP